MKTIFFYCILFLLIISAIAFGILFACKKETVAIIGAMDVEIEEVLNNLSDTRNFQQGDFKINTGNLGKYKIILSKSGVGKVNSSTTTQFIIDKYKPNFIINIGVAGSLSPDLKTGDTIIAEKTVQHDFDMTALGKPKGYIDDTAEADKPTIYYSDKNLIDKFTKNKNIKRGTVATGDIFVTDVVLKDAIRNDFAADAVDMESGAIVQTAKRNNIPVIILRTISDEQNDTAKEYKQNKPNTAPKSALMVINILKENN